MRVLGVRRKILSVAMIAITIALLLLAALQLGLNLTRSNLTPVQFKSGNAYLRVAATAEDREKGLSGIKNLPADEGLLMDFKTDQEWAIWMKDMYIPIDIVWLNKDKEVIYIVRDARPESGTSKTFKPLSPARYVIELNSGAAGRYMINVGDVIHFDQ